MASRIRRSLAREPKRDDDDLSPDTILQKTRLDIIKKLREKGGRSYISEMERELRISRSTICYHLDILEDMDIVEQEYELISEPQSRRGRVRSYYKLNVEQLTETIKEIMEMMPEVGR